MERIFWILIALIAYYVGYRRGRSWWIRVFDRPISHEEGRIIHGLEQSIEPDRSRLRFDRRDKC